jgi:hypothetical protein
MNCSRDAGIINNHAQEITHILAEEMIFKIFTMFSVVMLIYCT